MQHLFRVVAFVWVVSPLVNAYIPATGTNDTSSIQGLGSTDSTVLLRWTDMGSYQEGVSRQLATNQSAGIEKGALVHFWENRTIRAYEQYTTTPWIALVNCDTNSSDASMEEDIFTQARDRGAVASLLYSEYSESCLINPDYLNPTEFDKVLDIYATVTKSSARLIESQFSNVNKTLYYFFNGTRLNNSATAVNNSVSGMGVQPGYLIATLKWDNVTDPNPGDGDDSPTPTPPAQNNNGGSNTGLAMIILYVITGCVSLLFCIVIVSGAVRAMQHPERYGPRRGDPNVNGIEGMPQTRAAGLTRAILDTFPIVKFGRGQAPASSHEAQVVYHKPADDSEWAPRKEPTEGIELTKGNGGVATELEDSSRDHTRCASSCSQREDEEHRPTHQRNLSDKLDPTPEMIGVETCPICILDFEEGDDLRVLPCEGKHKFHKDCVDQWLLDLSTSCPLCREDFQALENMANGVSPEERLPPNGADSRSRRGFSRYLQTAQRRHEAAIAGRVEGLPYYPPLS